MMYDFPKLLQDYAVDYHPGHRGYTDVACPYCDDDEKHGGLHQEGRFNCWRCGYHNIEDVIRLLCNESWNSVKDRYIYQGDEIEEKFVPSDKIHLPLGSGELLKQHRKYLRDRGFDPDHLEKEYGIVATGNIGNFSHRIIIPIYNNFRLVSYLGRDWTGMSPMRYRACDREKEIIHHKFILYNSDRCKGDHGVLAEGCTDVWKLGRGAMATFGTGWTRHQRNFIIEKGLKKITLLFDAEEEASVRAQKIGEELAGVGLDIDMILLKEGDPGGLPQDEADSIMEDIFDGTD